MYSAALSSSSFALNTPPLPWWLFHHRNPLEQVCSWAQAAMQISTRPDICRLSCLVKAEALRLM
jgi:hypothetical protein